MARFSWILLSALAAVAQAGTIVWDGSFNPFSTIADFDKWSWASQVGTYQWYIHGSEPTSHYLALDPTFKNPALTNEKNGLKMTIDSGATWNSRMERAELIPQTTANLGTGQMFYHFSLKRVDTNAPDSTLEHQIMFFESHFTELKYGVGSNPTNLVWMVSGVEKWSTPFTADTWFNFAYDIDFSAGTVGLWASTGSSPLTKVVKNIAASTSTNSADFHVGVLRIVNTIPAEDWYVSGVYIESGIINTTIGSGSSSGSTTVTPTSAPTPVPTSESVPLSVPTSEYAPASVPTSKPAPSSALSSVPATTVTPTSTIPISTSSTAPDPIQSQWGQCGGKGYTGPTTCACPYTCNAVSPPYYYQCQ